MRNKNRQNFVSAVTKYGITVTDFKRMFDEQGGVCAICHRPDPSGRRLSIDHDHKTLKVRGLLCCICNVAISVLDMDADWSLKALQYLESNAAIVPAEKTKAYTPEWKERVRQGNIRTWADPRLRKKNTRMGRDGAKKQWSEMSEVQKEEKLKALQEASANFKLRMSEEQKRKKIESLRSGRRRWWDSLPDKQKKETVFHFNKKKV